MYREYLNELIRDLRDYSEIAEEAGKPWGAELMRRAARELERENGRPSAKGTTGHKG